MEAIGAIGVLIVLFFIVAGIVWFLMPFFILGTNKRLDKILDELKTLRNHAVMQPHGGSHGRQAGDRPSTPMQPLHVARKTKDGRYVLE